jgi:hypothetical protein
LTEDRRIEVTIKFRDMDKRIVGDVDVVLRELYAFLSSVLPAVSLASRISLTIDIQKFLESCQGVFAVTPEGIAIVGNIDMLSDKELVLLHLARARFGYLTKKFETDTVRIGDLIERTKSGAGTIAGRLSELCSEGLAERMGKGEYRATTLGLDHFLNTIVSKVRRIETGVSK